jgi:shikimate dehydrogenase
MKSGDPSAGGRVGLRSGETDRGGATLRGGETDRGGAGRRTGESGRRLEVDPAGEGDVTVWFIGVSTARSTINELLPAWAGFLGRRAVVRGRDVPLDAPASAYQAVLDELAAASRDVAGAVVTSHKVRLLDAARARFRQIDPLAEVLAEVSAIRPVDGGFDGFSRDAIAIRRTLDDVFGQGSGVADDVVCFGAGGSGRALMLALMTDRWDDGPPFAIRTPAPRTFHIVERDPARLSAFGRIARRVGVPDDRLRAHHLEGIRAAGELVATLPPRALVVNATGLGKDAPGSPIPGATRFPRDSIAWDFNYRGDLGFLDTAAAERRAGVRVMDGWRFFLHGWIEALVPLLGTPLDGDAFERLVGASEPFRPAASRARAALGPTPHDARS